MLAAILIGAITLLSDMLRKPRIEHYNWSGWHQLIFWELIAVGALVLITWRRGPSSGPHHGWLASVPRPFGDRQMQIHFKEDEIYRPRPHRGT